MDIRTDKNINSCPKVLYSVIIYSTDGRIICNAKAKTKVKTRD